MIITLKLENTDYSIEVEAQQFIAYKHGLTEKGANIGKETKSVLGFFSSVSKAVKKIVQDSHADSADVVSLQEYTERIEAAYTELMLQVDL